MAGLPTFDGGCLCGAIRYKARPLHMAMHACHCSLCRRWSGGVFMAVACSEVSVEGSGQIQTYPSSEWAERQFCKTCGSNLFYRLREGDHGVAVSLQSFDDAALFGFEEEIFIDSKPPQYAFDGERPRLTGEQVFARFSAKQEAQS